jgi:hypothetical protein
MFETVYSHPRPKNCAAGTLVVGEGFYDNLALSLVMAILWYILNRLIPPLIIPKFYSGYAHLKEQDRMMWDVKVVNVMFAVLMVSELRTEIRLFTS